MIINADTLKTTGISGLLLFAGLSIPAIVTGDSALLDNVTTTFKQQLQETSTDTTSTAKDNNAKS